MYLGQIQNSICHTYLKYILGRDTWGDYQVELAISVFQAKSTIVNAPSLTEVRIRHDSALEKAVLILLHNALHTTWQLVIKSYLIESFYFQGLWLKWLKWWSKLSFSIQVCGQNHL